MFITGSLMSNKKKKNLFLESPQYLITSPGIRRLAGEVVRKI
jgi:hypothetical protein